MNTLQYRTADDVRAERKEYYGNDPSNEKQLPLIAEEIGLRFMAARKQLFQIGMLMVEAKRIVGHGNFKTWISENLKDISYQTANNCMNVFLRCGGHPEIIDHLLPSVIYTISSPKFDGTLRAFMLDNVKKLDGNKIDVKSVTKLNRMYKDQEIDLESPVVEKVLGFAQDRDQYGQYCEKLEGNLAIFDRIQTVINNSVKQLRWPKLGSGDEVLLTSDKAEELEMRLGRIHAAIDRLKPDYRVVEEEELIPHLDLGEKD